MRHWFRGRFFWQPVRRAALLGMLYTVHCTRCLWWYMIRLLASPFLEQRITNCPNWWWYNLNITLMKNKLIWLDYLFIYTQFASSLWSVSCFFILEATAWSSAWNNIDKESRRGWKCRKRKLGKKVYSFHVTK